MTTSTFHAKSDLRVAGFMARTKALLMIEEGLTDIEKASPLGNDPDAVVQRESDAGAALIGDLTDAVLEIVGRYDEALGIDD